MAPEASLDALVAIANGFEKLESWRMGFDRNNHLRLSKDICASGVQSQWWSFLVRLRRGWVTVE